MKIVLCGGGTGGHFYPVIAVAQAFNDLVKSEKLLAAELYYIAPDPYNEAALYENNIRFYRNGAGKLRRYFSLLNVTDAFRTAWGIITATMTLFSIYPDVVFGTGGYQSFPVLVAARILGIPVVIHESDSKPGIVNAWAGKFARRVAISYPEAINYFKTEITALTGKPIRKEIQEAVSTGAFEYLNLDPALPTILILGGSQGSQKINGVVIDSIAELVKKYQIIHQTGVNNLEEVKKLASVVLNNVPEHNRYRPFSTLNNLELRMAAGACRIVISRAGSTIFEIAAWAKPSIIIPIPESISHDQTSNAFAYARTGAASVIEETNLTNHILVSEINRIVGNPDTWSKMSEAAKKFSNLEAAQKIAQEIFAIALEHEA